MVATTRENIALGDPRPCSSYFSHSVTKLH